MRKVRADLHNHLGPGGSFPSFNYVIDLARKRLGQGGILGIANVRQDEDRYEKFVDSPGYERMDIGNAIFVPSKQILVVKEHEVIKKEGHL